MLKIATVLLTTTVFAGLLISGPTSLVATAATQAGQTATVKVKTIAIRLPAAPIRVAVPADGGNLLDPNPLYVPAALAGGSNDLHRA